MIHKWKIPALLFMIAFLLLAVCACGKTDAGKTYDHLVTYDYNLGTQIDANCTAQYFGVADGATVALYPREDVRNFKLQAVIGYANEGWYTGKTDENGELMRDEEGRALLDRKWDFTRDTVNSDITLYANFLRNPTLSVVDEENPDTVYEQYSQVQGTSKKEPSKTRQPKKDGYTFYGYYTADGERFTWPFVFGNEDVTVYARFLSGNYTIVNDAKEFCSAYALGQNIYLDADIAFDGDNPWIAGRDYGGTIEGNGHTLSGISASFCYDRNTTVNFGLIGTLKSGAVLHDLHIVNAEVTFTAGLKCQGIEVGFLAWTCEENVTVDGVTVTGTLTRATDETTTDSDIVFYPFLPGANAETHPTCDWSGVTVQ